MKCPGLHCPGCGDGSGQPVLYGGGALAAVLAAEWVTAHAWEVLAVTAACGALAVAAVVALMRWGDRRAARHAIEHPFLITARPVPEITRAGRPYLEASARAAIGPAREVHLHLNVMPDQLAAIVRHYTEGEQ
jgi:hypothetical protein